MFFFILCLNVIAYHVTSSQLIDAKVSLIKNSQNDKFENLKLKSYVNKLKNYVHNNIDINDNRNVDNLNEVPPMAEYENNEFKESNSEYNQDDSSVTLNDFENNFEFKPQVYNFFDNNQISDDDDGSLKNQDNSNDDESDESDENDESYLNSRNDVEPDNYINYKKIIVENSDSLTTQTLLDYIENSKKLKEIENSLDINEDNSEENKEKLRNFFKQVDIEETKNQDKDKHLFSTTKGIVVFTVSSFSCIILVTIVILVVRKVLRNRRNRKTHIHEYQTVPTNESEDEQLLS